MESSVHPSSQIAHYMDYLNQAILIPVTYSNDASP